MFVYLNKKINYTCDILEYNPEGYLLISNGINIKIINNEYNQTIDVSSNIVSFNKKLAISNNNNIQIYTIHKNIFIEEFINKNTKNIKSLKWNTSGDYICILYDDGLVVGSAEGSLLFKKDITAALIAWVGADLYLISEGELQKVDLSGIVTRLEKTEAQHLVPTVSRLALIKGNTIQVGDILIETSLELFQVLGYENFFLIVGYASDKSIWLHVFSIERRKFVQKMNIPGSRVKSVTATEGKIAMSVDDYIYLGRVHERKRVLWYNNTLVKYADQLEVGAVKKSGFNVIDCDADSMLVCSTGDAVLVLDSLGNVQFKKEVKNTRVFISAGIVLYYSDGSLFRWEYADYSVLSLVDKSIQVEIDICKFDENVLIYSKNTVNIYNNNLYLLQEYQLEYEVVDINEHNSTLGVLDVYNDLYILKNNQILYKYSNIYQFMLKNRIILKEKQRIVVYNGDIIEDTVSSTGDLLDFKKLQLTLYDENGITQIESRVKRDLMKIQSIKDAFDYAQQFNDPLLFSIVGKRALGSDPEVAKECFIRSREYYEYLVASGLKETPYVLSHDEEAEYFYDRFEYARSLEIIEKHQLNPAFKQDLIRQIEQKLQLDDIIITKEYEQALIDKHSHVELIELYLSRGMLTVEFIQKFNLDPLSMKMLYTLYAYQSNEWKYAEAYHFYLVVLRSFYGGKVDYSVLFEYVDIIPELMSLLVVVGYYNDQGIAGYALNYLIEERGRAEVLFEPREEELLRFKLRGCNFEGVRKGRRCLVTCALIEDGVQCHQCKRFISKEEYKKRKTCPLCHSSY